MSKFFNCFKNNTKHSSWLQISLPSLLFFEYFQVYQLDIQSDSTSNQTYNGTCVSLNRQPMLLIYSWLVFGSLVVLAVGPMIWLYKYNKRMSHLPGTGSLTTRYQYNDNALVLHIFLPLFVIGVFCVGSLCSLIILYIFWQLLSGKPVTTQTVLLIRVSHLCE